MSADLAVLAVFVVGGIIGYVMERREWNGGTCRRNGLAWQHLDTDSHGCRGYAAGDETCWIGWPVDKQEARHD